MTEKTDAPAAKSEPKWLKPVVDYGPLVAFFVSYYMNGGSDNPHALLEATKAIMAATAIAVILSLIVVRRLPVMPLVTAVVVGVFGGLTLWFADETFIKMKPTMLYLLFGGLLGIGLLRGQSWLKVVMEEVMPLQQEGWMILTRRLCAFFFGLAVANELIWRTQSTDAWVYFKTFGLPVAMFAFFMLQGQLFQKYGVEDEAGPAE